MEIETIKYLVSAKWFLIDAMSDVSLLSHDCNKILEKIDTSIDMIDKVLKSSTPLECRTHSEQKEVICEHKWILVRSKKRKYCVCCGYTTGI